MSRYNFIRYKSSIEKKHFLHALKVAFVHALVSGAHIKISRLYIRTKAIFKPE